jgi:hypothetical protein
MPRTTITLRVDDAERDDLAARAAREKVNLSDYIRVRLGLRAQGSQDDVDIEVDAQHDQAVREQMADHERRLRALEADYARGGVRSA